MGYQSIMLRSGLDGPESDLDWDTVCLKTWAVSADDSILSLKRNLLYVANI